MKMFIVTLIFLIICQVVMAPGLRCFFLIKQEPISHYDALVKAIIQVESRDDVMALNLTEQACGPMQIRECRVQHYNRLTGSNYKLEDCFDYDVSKQIFLYFAQGKSYAKAAMNWNGSGPKTKNYWKKVLTKLN